MEKFTKSMIMVSLADLHYGEWFRLTPNGQRWRQLICDPRPYFHGKKIQVEVMIRSEDKEGRWVRQNTQVYPCDAPLPTTLPIDIVGKRVG